MRAKGSRHPGWYWWVLILLAGGMAYLFWFQPLRHPLPPLKVEFRP